MSPVHASHGRCSSSAFGLVGDNPATLDLKIAAAAIAEMREAFAMFAPYKDVPKVTVFGSARTATNDPLYSQATEIARLLADRGWMVVTGAGPGIMQAAMEGAGRERSIGVSIRLPFEQGANPVIAGDEKSVSMKYFFTRKLMLVKESRAFVCLPGGFGTLDETFELLTLTQTGKGLPVPIIFLDMPNDVEGGDSFWGAVDALVQDQLVTRNLVSAKRHAPVLRDRLVRGGRPRRSSASTPTTTRSGTWATRRSSGCATGPPLSSSPSSTSATATSCSQGRIDTSAPLSVEVRQADRVELPRIRFQFAHHRYGDLSALIDTLNSWAPPPAHPPPPPPTTPNPI